MIKAVIFDVDGVVFDSRDDEGNYLWQRNLKADLGLTRDILDQLLETEWMNITRGKVDLKEHLYRAFQDASLKKLNLTPETYIAYWCEHDSHVNMPMLELAQSLKIPIYLGTNQDPYRTVMIRERVGGAFRGVFSSCEIGAIKPEAAFFEHIEKALQLNPVEFLLIDDTRANVDAAKARGWLGYLHEGDLEELKGFLTSLEIEEVV